MKREKLDEMKKLAAGEGSLPRTLEALGIWSKPPDEGTGEPPEVDELEDVKHDMDIIDAVLPQLNKLVPSPGKQKILKAVEVLRNALEKDAVELNSILRRQRR